MATPTGPPCPGGFAADGSADGSVVGVGVGVEGGIGVPTGVALGVATTGGVGGWGVVFAAVGVGARVAWARTGSGVGKGAGLGIGAVTGAGWMVANAVFEGWLGLTAPGGTTWAVAAGEGEAPEPEAPELVNAGSSNEDSSAWLRW